MKAFTALTATLQLGVWRSPFVASEVLGEGRGLTGEKGAITEAGILDLMRRAGVSAHTSIQPLYGPSPEAKGTATKSETALMAAIDLGLREVVLEWAQAAAKEGLVAPSAALVKLIEWTPKHRKELTAILGAKGYWLAELMGVEIGASEAQFDPDELRAMLQSDWQELDWKQRVAGIANLEATLQPCDEELLTVALGDRRKEVREPAAKCLANLDGSKFASELRAFAKGRIRVDQKLLVKSLAIRPPKPEELPAGIPRTMQPASFGEKAHAMFDLLRLIRPSFWEEETGLSPTDLIELAEKTNYSGAVIGGWQDAAASAFLDQKWIDALFQHFITLNVRQPIRTLAPLASLPVYEAAFQARLKTTDYMPMRQDRFTPEFSRLVVESIKLQIVVVDDEMSRCLDGSVLPLLREPWDSSADTRRERWYRSLDLRNKLLQSLEP